MHLSRLPEHRDRNFAQSFSVLDRLFASYYAPGYDGFPRPVWMGLSPILCSRPLCYSRFGPGQQSRQGSLVGQGAGTSMGGFVAFDVAG
jgi:hypothetical protein